MSFSQVEFSFSSLHKFETNSSFSICISVNEQSNIENKLFSALSRQRLIMSSSVAIDGKNNLFRVKKSIVFSLDR